MTDMKLVAKLALVHVDHDSPLPTKGVVHFPRVIFA